MQRPHLVDSTSTPQQPPSLTDSQSSQQDIKTVSPRSPTATLPALRPADLRIDQTVQEEKGVALHTGVYDGQAVGWYSSPLKLGRSIRRPGWLCFNAVHPFG